MSDISEKRHRRSLRLKDYDYSQAGAYFVTVCIQRGKCLLGEISDKKMAINEAGRMVERWWAELPNKFPAIEIDYHVVMPNHFHGIVFITDPIGTALRGGPNPIDGQNPVGAALCGSPNDVEINSPGHPHRGAPTGLITNMPSMKNPTIGDIVDWFKTMTTNEYIRGVKELGWPSFQRSFWQRNYYEHVIRNENSLNRIREYIVNNPLRWHLDRENPNRTREDEFDRWLSSL